VLYNIATTDTTM